MARGAPPGPFLLCAVLCLATRPSGALGGAVVEARPYCVLPSDVDAVPFRPYRAALGAVPLAWNGGVSRHDWAVSVCEPAHFLPAAGAAWGTQRGCDRPAFFSQFRPGARGPDATVAGAVPSNLCEVAFDTVVTPPVWERRRDGDDVVRGVYAASTTGYNLSLVIRCGTPGSGEPTAGVSVDFPPRQYNLTVWDPAACEHTVAVWELSPLELAAIAVTLAIVVAVAYRVAVNRYVRGRRGWAALHPGLAGDADAPDAGRELAPPVPPERDARPASAIQ